MLLNAAAHNVSIRNIKVSKTWTSHNVQHHKKYIRFVRLRNVHFTFCYGIHFVTLYVMWHLCFENFTFLDSCVVCLLSCVQLRFVTLCHVTFTICCFTLCSNITFRLCLLSLPVSWLLLQPPFVILRWLSETTSIRIGLHLSLCSPIVILKWLSETASICIGLHLPLWFRETLWSSEVQ